MSGAGSDASEELPTVDELKKAVDSERGSSAALQSSFEREFEKSAVSSEMNYAHLAGLVDHYKHKRYWSYFIMKLMADMLIFQMFLLAMVGWGYWDFSQYTWLLPALLVQNLAQIVGLAVFVVKSLFRDVAGMDRA